MNITVAKITAWPHSWKASRLVTCFFNIHQSIKWLMVRIEGKLWAQRREQQQLVWAQPEFGSFFYNQYTTLHHSFSPCCTVWLVNTELLPYVTGACTLNQYFCSRKLSFFMWQLVYIMLFYHCMVWIVDIELYRTSNDFFWKLEGVEWTPTVWGVCTFFNNQIIWTKYGTPTCCVPFMLIFWPIPSEHLRVVDNPRHGSTCCMRQQTDPSRLQVSN